MCAGPRRSSHPGHQQRRHCPHSSCELEVTDVKKTQGQRSRTEHQSLGADPTGALPVSMGNQCSTSSPQNVAWDGGCHPGFVAPKTPSCSHTRTRDAPFAGCREVSRHVVGDPRAGLQGQGLQGLWSSPWPPASKKPRASVVRSERNPANHPSAFPRGPFPSESPDDPQAWLRT